MSDFSPLYIQSSKICAWLLSRKLVPTDYPKKLQDLEQKIKDAIRKTGVDFVILKEWPSLYLGCQNMLAKIRTDDQTDFFGRSSPNVRMWLDIVDGFRRNNLYLIEVAEALHDIAAVLIPKCRIVISERQKQLISLRQKLKELSLNVTQKECALERAYKQFGMTNTDVNIKLRLLEAALDVPNFLEDYVRRLNELLPAVNLYDSFASFVNRNSSHDPTTPGCCVTLRRLIQDGHILVFTWRTGCEPSRIEPDDDFIPSLLAKERLLIQSKSERQEACFEVDLNKTAEIVWDELEDVEGDLHSTNLASDDIELESENASTDVLHSNFQNEPPVEFLPEDESRVATGTESRRLLDSIEGRNALLDDLLELSSFLSRFNEDLLDLQGSECSMGSFNQISSNTRTACLATLEQIIIQNAPPLIQSCTSSEIVKMIRKVEDARLELTNSSFTHLMMIRVKPGYLDRLTNRLLDHRRHMERAKSRVLQTQHQIDEALAEQEFQTHELMRHRISCKSLVNFLEEELSKLCGRPVQIIGQAMDT